MTTVLTLTGGGESIDFIGGTEFKLSRDGLLLPPPEPIRVMAGDPLLTEGRSLLARRYGNRQIGIKFQAMHVTHNALVASLQKLSRILNHAVKARQSCGMMAGATLTFKLDAQSTQVTFDILDGDIKLAGPLNELLRRNNVYLGNELDLIAQPYARGSVVRLENYLVNPGFDNNPGVTGRDGGYYITFGGTGNRLERADCSGIADSGIAQFLGGVWCYPTGGSGEQVIMRAGNNWEIAWDPTGLRFYGRLGTGAQVTSAQTFSLNTWYHVQLLAMQITGTYSGQLLMLVVNRKLAGIMRHTDGNMPGTGKFAIGAQDDDTRRFTGHICGAYVLKRNIWPWQLRFLFEYGMRSLVRGTAGDLSGTPPGSDYWDLTDAEYGGVWVFDQASGNISDSGPGSRTLTLVGSPTYTANYRVPAGWSIFGTPSTTHWSALVSSPRKYGPFSLYCHKTTAVSTPQWGYQYVTIPTYKRGASANRDWEFCFWAQPLTDGAADTIKVQIYGWDGGATALLVNTTLNLAAGMNEYGVKFTHGASDIELRVYFMYPGATTAVDVYIANPMLVPGTPFGFSGSLVQITPETPWISSRFLVNTPPTSGGGKERNLRVYGLPGDEPLGTRVYTENPK